MPTENFFSPIQFEKYNVSYDFRECPSKKAMYQEVMAVLDECRARNERTIIFTKNDRITEFVTKAVDYTAMPFSHNDLNAYTQFSEGYIDSLISSEELGIGINFPNIRNVIHFGLPLSKNEYVQEIGRAGRSNERVRSYVLYLSDNITNAPEGLISRELDINRLPDLMKHIDNDYSDIFHKLTGNISRKEELLSLHSLMIVFQYSRRIVCVIRSIPVPPNLKNHRIFQTHCLKNPTVFVGTDYLALTHPQISFKIFLEKTQKSAESTADSALCASHGGRP